MKKRFLIALIVASIFTIAETMAIEPPPPERRSHSSSSRNVDSKTGIYVSCNISGASVYLDGKYMGTTPLLLDDLESGRYRLEVTKAHYSTDSSYIYVDDGRVREAKCYLEKISGLLQVETVPKGATIYYDGSPAYTSLLELDEGYHTISAKEFGYNTFSKEVYVERGSNKSLTLQLSIAEFDITYAEPEKAVFNPKNHGVLGNNILTFSVTGPGRGVVEISDKRGIVVYSEDISFNTWTQSIEWLGTDYQGFIVDDGIYTATLKAERKEESMIFSVDSSIEYPMHTLTPGGLGIGSVSSARLYPISTTLASITAGCDFINSDKVVYGVPINAGFAWTPTSFMEFNVSFIGNISIPDPALGFNATLKVGYHNKIEMVNLFYGAFFRIGSLSEPIKEPYGTDCGAGIGGGIVFGVDFQDFYVGLESTYVYRPVVGPFMDSGDDCIWKNGVMLQKLFDDWSVGLYGSTTTGFGTYKDKSTGSTTNIRSDIRSVDLGGKIAHYLGRTAGTLGIEGGTLIYPQNGFATLFTDSSRFYPYAKLNFTWMF